MDKFRKFQESFAAYFKALYKAVNGKSNRELDEALVQQGISEEQRLVIKETCCDVDKEHDMIEEMNNSDKTPGEFLEDDIIDAIKTAHPNAAEEEMHQVVETAMDTMENEIGQEANEFSNESLIMYNSLQQNSETDNNK